MRPHRQIVRPLRSPQVGRLVTSRWPNVPQTLDFRLWVVHQATHVRDLPPRDDGGVDGTAQHGFKSSHSRGAAKGSRSVHRRRMASARARWASVTKFQSTEVHRREVPEVVGLGNRSTSVSTALGCHRDPEVIQRGATAHQQLPGQCCRCAGRSVSDRRTSAFRRARTTTARVGCCEAKERGKPNAWSETLPRTAWVPLNPREPTSTRSACNCSASCGRRRPSPPKVRFNRGSASQPAARASVTPLATSLSASLRPLARSSRSTR